MSEVRVLVVEDEARAARAHAAYVDRLEGFVLTGVARSAHEAARMLTAARGEGAPVDLMLLDMNLPDGHGLGLLQKIRAAGHLCDVIALTAARDAEVVRAAVAQGVVLYLIKPFTFPMFRGKLEKYAAYRSRSAATGELAQDEIDALMGFLRAGAPGSLPKGMSADTMAQVSGALRASATPLSASEVAELVGASRVTMRRYLEHLADTGRVSRAPRYGRGGRPELEYSWS